MGKLISGMVIRPKCQKHLLQTEAMHFYESIIGQEVQTVLRKGKYIILPLSNSNAIVFHLGMTGRLLLQPVPNVAFDERFTGEDHVDKHTHFLMELTDVSNPDAPDLELQFHDVRMFGAIWLAEDIQNIENLDIPGLRDLGPDALGISLQEFESFIKSKASVKSLLLNQNNLAGVGNIYADEACFLAKVHPSTRGEDLDVNQRMRLWFAIKTVLKEGIRYRGSSVSDYTTADGSKGSYQEHHRVYGKTGKKCVDCANMIQRTKVVGRSTHFCPSCQTKGAA